MIPLLRSIIEGKAKPRQSFSSFKKHLDSHPAQVTKLLTTLKKLMLVDEKKIYAEHEYSTKIQLVRKAFAEYFCYLFVSYSEFANATYVDSTFKQHDKHSDEYLKTVQTHLLWDNFMKEKYEQEFIQPLAQTIELIEESNLKREQYFSCPTQQEITTLIKQAKRIATCTLAVSTTYKIKQPFVKFEIVDKKALVGSNIGAKGGHFFDPNTFALALHIISKTKFISKEIALAIPNKNYLAEMSGQIMTIKKIITNFQRKQKKVDANIEKYKGEQSRLLLGLKQIVPAKSQIIPESTAKQIRKVRIIIQKLERKKQELINEEKGAVLRRFKYLNKYMDDLKAAFGNQIENQIYGMYEKNQAA